MKELFQKLRMRFRKVCGLDIVIELRKALTGRHMNGCIKIVILKIRKYTKLRTPSCKTKTKRKVIVSVTNY